MKTPLFHEHERLHAKIVDFHGWEMPVWYTGIMEEHQATRDHAGLFDASHMGEILVTGDQSVPFLNRVLTRDIPAMQKNRVLYTFLLNDEGGIIDDLTVYCIDPGQAYMLCVNASNTENDLAWIRSHNSEGAAIEDRSPCMSLLALQGPDASHILSACLGFDPDTLKYYTFASVLSAGFGEVLVSRTGYTGAGGAELFLGNGQAPLLWKALVEQGAVPCGLGARDTLRLEMGFPLHGSDIDETTTPLEAGLAFAVDFGKNDFIGRKSLERQSHDGLKRRLWGLMLEDRGIPRQGCVCMKGDREVGTVTSGSISPVLGSGIALAYLSSDVRKDDEVDIVVRSRRLRARVVNPPFVRNAASK